MVDHVAMEVLTSTASPPLQGERREAQDAEFRV